MHKNRISLVNPILHTTQLQPDSLLINISKNSISYAVVDSEMQEVLALSDIQNEQNIISAIQDLFKNEVLLNKEYAVVKVCYQTPNEYLIPKEFSDSNLKETYAQYFSNLEETALQTAAINSNLDALIEIPNYLDKILKTKPYKTCSYVHAIAPLLQIGVEDGCFYNFGNNEVQILVKENGKLLFQNTFEIGNSEEFNYYLLATQQEVKKDKNYPCFITGLIDDNDPKISVIYKYFKIVNFIECTSFGIKGDILYNYPLHYFSTLLALDKCA